MAPAPPHGQPLGAVLVQEARPREAAPRWPLVDGAAEDGRAVARGVLRAERGGGEAGAPVDRAPGLRSDIA